MKILLNALLFAMLALFLQGCFQAHSDDGLRTVPVTNNPHVIQDGSRTAQVPGGGF